MNVKNTVIRWFILTIAVWVATLVPGINFADWQSLMIAALVLSFLNTLVKPFLMLLSAPFIIITLGVFLLLINAFLLKFTAWLVPGFSVDTFLSAMGGSLVISIVSLFFGGPRPDIHACERYTYHCVPRREAPPGNGPVIDV